MGFSTERTNPFGSNRFCDLYTDEDIEHMRGIIDIVHEITKELDVSKDIRKFTTYDASRKLISVGVDGGSQEIFPFISELSSSIIRISSKSDDLTEPTPSFEQIIKYTKFSRKFYSFRDSTLSQDNVKKIVAEQLNEEMNQIFQNDIIKRFSSATGITIEDLGITYSGDLEAFTGILRNVLEWAYIIDLAEKFKHIKVLIMKDGRLEQHGVANSFVDKLKNYFETNNVFIVGVLKQNAIFREGISNIVINNWVSDLEEPFYFKTPEKLMDFVYANRRQWDPFHEKTFIFGHRHFGKLYGKTFNPMQSMIAFDIPYYFENNHKNIHEIATTLFAHKSLLFGGSITVVSDAHAKASISSKIVREIEYELEKRLGIKLPKIIGV